MTQIIWPQPPTWDIQLEFQTFGFILAIMAIWVVTQWMENVSLFVSLSFPSFVPLKLHILNKIYKSLKGKI